MINLYKQLVEYGIHAIIVEKPNNIVKSNVVFPIITFSLNEDEYIIAYRYNVYEIFINKHISIEFTEIKSIDNEILHFYKHSGNRKLSIAFINTKHDFIGI